jgi:hypothetical protein
MIDALRCIAAPPNPGLGLFWFALHDELRTSDSLRNAWRDGWDRPVCLV